VGGHEEHKGRADFFAAGDYSFWSRIFEPSSEALIRSTGIVAGDLVLDVAAGNGNAAIAAARAGATVVALDLSTARIERGRPRTEGDSVAWVQGDAERLPFADGTFRGVVNSLGDVIAIEEMFRVATPVGVVAITEWTGDGFLGEYEALYDRVELDPNGTLEPGTPPHRPRWGQEPYVRERFGPHAERLELDRRTVYARAGSVTSFVEELLRDDPYVPRVPADRRTLSEELRRLATVWNEADDGTVLLGLTYLLTVATKPGGVTPAGSPPSGRG
jgi:SAM-dependent methyltransferase